MTCENCGGVIGNLETPHVFNQHTVCAACHAKLTSPVPQPITGRTGGAPRALGLDSRGMCIGIAAAGIVIALFFGLPGMFIGLAMVVWACIADWMLHKAQRR